MKVAKAAAAILAAALALALALTALAGSQAARDYASSPLCGGSPGGDCRTLEVAAVDSIRPATQPPAILIDVEAGDGRLLTARLSPSYRTSAMPKIGARIEIEVWRGQVTKVELPGRGLVRTRVAAFP